VRAIVCTFFLFAASAHAQQIVTLRGPDAHGRWFDLSSARGKMVVVTFGSRGTEKDARAINEQLQRHAGDGVMVVSVVDLRGIPRIGWNLAMKKVREADRPNKLRHLVDKTGEIARGFGVDPQHHVDMFVVDRRGRLVGHYEGAQQLASVEARLHQVAARSVRHRARQ
jgi:hypothetical protein